MTVQAEVGDELAEGYSRAGVFKQAGRSERSGADAAAFVGVDGGHGAIKIREFRRPGLAIDLMLGQRQQAPDADPGIVLDGHLFCLGAVSDAGDPPGLCGGAGCGLRSQRRKAVCDAAP